MSKKVLVTGGAGRLGNYVAPYLKSKGYKVTTFDINLPAPDSRNAKEHIPFVKGDLLSLGDCMRAIAHAEADVIVHLGAIPFNTEIQAPYAKEYDRYLQNGARFTQRMDEDLTMKTNTMGTYYLLDAARRLGVKKIVFTSTYYVLRFGFMLSGKRFMPEYLPIDEEHPCDPEDTYGLSKLLGEEICRSFSNGYGIDAVVLRLLGVYYPDSEFAKMVYKFGVNVPPIENENEGYIVGNTYQYVDARDIARLVELSIEAKNLNPFEVFYAITDSVYTEPTTEVIAKRWPNLAEMGKDIPGTEGIISFDKARRLLGYEPAYSWRDGKNESSDF
ncbi:MAG: NAD(P)-dependent oxidoreductase [Clostridiales bacterium]|jgi:UDP-glucose 4-epimerase|nr:NAD(P)-dependent oxidoreductase [Bacillota bacterium]NLW00772.1 NAD(P)-dependent oxidoreductase [Clostridiales bacterium]